LKLFTNTALPVCAASNATRRSAPAARKQHTQHGQQFVSKKCNMF
jgi:hypothetical protein